MALQDPVASGLAGVSEEEQARQQFMSPFVEQKDLHFVRTQVSYRIVPYRTVPYRREESLYVVRTHASHTIVLYCILSYRPHQQQDVAGMANKHVGSFVQGLV